MRTEPVQAVLIRHNDDRHQTLGTLNIYEGVYTLFTCRILEPAWMWNQPNVSCAPPGDYILVKRTSEKYGDHLQILRPNRQEIPGRTFMLMHFGNYRKNTKGCQLPGRAFLDIDGDGYRDVSSSKATMKDILSMMPDETPYRIVDLTGINP